MVQLQIREAPVLVVFPEILAQLVKVEEHLQ
jgi:hypothetical protein